MFSVPSTFENTYYDIGTRFVKGIKGLRWINNYRVLLLVYLESSLQKRKRKSSVEQGSFFRKKYENGDVFEF